MSERLCGVPHHSGGCLRDGYLAGGDTLKKAVVRRPYRRLELSLFVICAALVLPTSIALHSALPDDVTLLRSDPGKAVSMASTRRVIRATGKASASVLRNGSG
jgi:hypothetical protein